MSSTNCLVRLADNLLYGEPSPSIINPNTDLYMEVTTELADVSSFTTRNYRWNVKESKFYDAGIKDQAGKDPDKVILSPFATTDNYHFRGQGLQFTVPAGATIDHDVYIPEERMIDGSMIWVGTPVYGCTVDLQVVDLAGTLAPAGTVLDEFATGWQLHPSTQNVKKPGYPAKLYSGLYVRIKFTNPSANEITVYGNLDLHEHKDNL